MKKRIKMLTAALCAVVLLCGFSVTAYAGGGPEWEGLDPSEETSTPEPLSPARASPRRAAL